MNPTYTLMPSNPLQRTLLPFAIGLLALAAACAQGPTGPGESGGLSPVFHHNPGHGGGPSGGGAETTRSGVITTISGPGLYSDGGGAYVFSSADGMGAKCPRQMVLDLTGESGAFTWPLETPSDADCQKKKSQSFARLTIPGLDPDGLFVGQVIGADPDLQLTTNLCCVLNYYFGDNVVWKNGIRVIDLQRPDANTTIATLSTDPDLATAELWDRDAGGISSLGPVTAHLELVVTIVTGS